MVHNRRNTLAPALCRTTLAAKLLAQLDVSGLQAGKSEIVLDSVAAYIAFLRVTSSVYTIASGLETVTLAEVQCGTNIANMSSTSMF